MGLHDAIEKQLKFKNVRCGTGVRTCTYCNGEYTTFCTFSYRSPWLPSCVTASCMTNGDSTMIVLFLASTSLPLHNLWFSLIRTSVAKQKCALVYTHRQFVHWMKIFHPSPTTLTFWKCLLQTWGILPDTRHRIITYMYIRTYQEWFRSWHNSHT